MNRVGLSCLAIELPNKGLPSFSVLRARRSRTRPVRRPGLLDITTSPRTTSKPKPKSIGQHQSTSDNDAPTSGRNNTDRCRRALLAVVFDRWGWSRGSPSISNSSSLTGLFANSAQLRSKPWPTLRPNPFAACASNRSASGWRSKRPRPATDPALACARRHHPVQVPDARTREAPRARPEDQPDDSVAIRQTSRFDVRIARRGRNDSLHNPPSSRRGAKPRHDPITRAVAR